MYGLAGERDLREVELPHLQGYEQSRLVRIGNGAADQYQADVVGEEMIALARLRDAEVAEDDYSWDLQKNLLRYCEDNFDRKDHGIWEMRGDAHYFTHGRAMMWAAFDQGIKAVERDALDGPVERWRHLRARLATEIDARGFDTMLNRFTQTDDNDGVDASLLHRYRTTAGLSRALVEAHGGGPSAPGTGNTPPGGIVDEDERRSAMTDHAARPTTIPGYIDDKDSHLTRLRRIEGQVRGLQRMVEADTYCIDILTQVSAATKALEAVALGLLDDHLRHCMVHAANDPAHLEEKLSEASTAIARLVRS